MKTPSINTRSRSRILQWAAGVSLLTLAVGTNAQVLITEDFESGTVGSAPANWVAGTGTISINSTNHTGTKSAAQTSSLDKWGRPLGQEISTQFKATFYLYDGNAPSSGGANRAFGEMRAHSGTYPTGLQQTIAAGKFNNNFNNTAAGEFFGEQAVSTLYQGRCLAGTNPGFFNLNNPGVAQSKGWHRFDIERMPDLVTFNVYVDGVLGRTVHDASIFTFDTFTIGSAAAGSSPENALYDDIRIEINQPIITAQPIGQTNSVGQTVNLSVTASGLATINYQWKRGTTNLVDGTTASGSVISGSTTANLTISNAQLGDSATNYTVVCTNSVDTATSTKTTVLVNPLTLVTTQPQSTRVNVGETATFTIAASGNGTLLYQWRKNGTNILGQTDATLNIANAQVADQANYTCMVTNDVHDPSALSSPANLQVNTAPVITTGNMTLAIGSSLEIPVLINDDYSTNGVPFENFESYSLGQTKMFQSPDYSGSTTTTTGASNLDLTLPRFTRVTNSYPTTGGHGSGKVLKSTWSWRFDPSGVTANGWLRYTSSPTTNSGPLTVSFSPIIVTNRSLRFDMYTDHTLKIAYTVRETNPTGAVGTFGGSSGQIESILAGANPPRGSVEITGGSWTTVDWNLSTINPFAMVSFIGAGNGKLESTTGKVAFEGLIIDDEGALAGDTNYATENIYLDNFVMTPADPVAYTLDSGPADAKIDPVTGLISWLPPGLGSYDFTVSVTDTGSFITPGSGLTTQKTFTVTIANPAPSPTKLTYNYNKPNVTLSWTNSSFGLQSADVVTGPWTDIPGATTGFITNTASAPKFFRLKY